MVLRLLLSFAIVGLARAQVPSDSLTHYELGEIVVGPGGIQPREPSVSTVQRVGLAGIAQSDAESIDRVLRSIPAGHLQTNSRGETLIYLRGAGERQVSLFFDGALLNVPWDNRIDLSLIPSEVVGEVTIAKGVPSVLYGPNVIGGAINLTSRELRNPGSLTQISGILGSHNASQARFTWLRRSKQFRSTVYLGASGRDGFGLPRNADLPYSQSSEMLRTNTYRNMRSAFGQVAWHNENGVSLGLSLLRFDGRKGVAPEGHLNPEVSNVRFWQYDGWETNMSILSGQMPVGSGTLRGAAWYSWFDQSIEQFSDATYAHSEGIQTDQDNTFGTRLTLLQEVSDSGTLRAALNLLTSQHRQINNADPWDRQSYRQHIYSNGLEYTWAGPVQVTAGASLDILATPETGDKPSRAPQAAYGISIGALHQLSQNITFRAAAGRKVRFPTMREMFGEALGRFLVNPDLKPESSLLTEAAARIENIDSSVEAVFFFNRTYNTINQHMVAVPGEELRRRQRINLDGSRVTGLETVLVSRMSRGLLMNCNMTWMKPRALNNGHVEPLVEKPSWLGGCSLTLRSTGGVSLIVESQITGRAYGLADDNSLVMLPASQVIHTRLAWLALFRSMSAEVFARVNNLTDDMTLPQLGLPGPGREVHAGLQLAF